MSVNVCSEPTSGSISSGELYIYSITSILYIYRSHIYFINRNMNLASVVIMLSRALGQASGRYSRDHVVCIQAGSGEGQQLPHHHTDEHILIDEVEAAGGSSSALAVGGSVGSGQ